MPPSVTAAAAAAHDARTASCYARLTRSSLCTAGELATSVAQARLPHTGGFGGASLFSAVQRAPAKFVSARARALASCRANVPGMSAFSFVSDATPSAQEFRDVLQAIHDQRSAVASDYAAYDANFIDIAQLRGVSLMHACACWSWPHHLWFGKEGLLRRHVPRMA